MAAAAIAADSDTSDELTPHLMDDSWIENVQYSISRIQEGYETAHNEMQALAQQIMESQTQVEIKVQDISERINKGEANDAANNDNIRK